MSVAGTANDPTIKFALLEIDGKTYQLCFDFNTIAKVQKATGVALLQGLLNLNDLTAEQLIGLLFAALRKAHPEMVVMEQAGALIRMDTMPKVMAAIVETWKLSMPVPSDEKKTSDSN